MSDFLEIKSGRSKQPLNMVLYSTPGWGKSNFAAGAPNPIFVGCEENSELDVDRFPIVGSYDEILKQVESLLTNKTDYKTIVIDSLDSIEQLIHSKVLKMDGKGATNIAAAAGGYGKGYLVASREFMALKELLKRLRDEKGFNIIMIAHSKKRTATDTVMGLTYDTFETNLHEGIQSLAVDWSQACLFGSYEAYQSKSENSDKVFAVGDGRRRLYCDRRPGFLAKNRFGLPAAIDANQDTGFVDFADFYKYYEAFYESGPSADSIIKEIMSLCENVKDVALKDKIAKNVESANGDVTKLKRYLQRCQELTRG